MIHKDIKDIYIKYRGKHGIKADREMLEEMSEIIFILERLINARD